MYTNGEIVITLTTHTLSIESCTSNIVFYFENKNIGLDVFLEIIKEAAGE
ncbi:hypothetical protein AB6831_04400 [Carnobacterium divergens]